MLKASKWVIAGAAVLATAGVAHAQDRQASPALAPAATASDAANAAAVPWYQRFTTSNGVTESITGQGENDRAATITPTWTLNQHWGVTVDVREARRIERLPEAGHSDEASVGAYYQFTPRVRVGGQVSVETDEIPLAAPGQRENEEPRAGVRIQSAFRF